MLLDAGHDLSAIPDAKAFFAGSETGKVRRATLERDEMDEATAMWALLPSGYLWPSAWSEAATGSR